MGSSNRALPAIEDGMKASPLQVLLVLQISYPKIVELQYSDLTVESDGLSLVIFRPTAP